MVTGKVPDTGKAPGTFRGLSIATLILGVLGVAFYWWVPMGMVMSLAGLMVGITDWTLARRRSLDFRLGIVGVVLSAAALALDLMIVVLGLQLVTFGSQ